MVLDIVPHLLSLFMFIVKPLSSRAWSYITKSKARGRLTLARKEGFNVTLIWNWCYDHRIIDFLFYIAAQALARCHNALLLMYLCLLLPSQEILETNPCVAFTTMAECCSPIVVGGIKSLTSVNRLYDQVISPQTSSRS